MVHEAKAKSITEAQFNMFMDALRKLIEKECPFYVKYWENIFYCASEMGLRSAETVKIKIQDIDFVEKTLTLPEQKNKEKFEKIIIPDFLLSRLKDHILTYKTEILNSNDYIFWKQRKSRGSKVRDHLCTGSIRGRLIKARKAAGLDHKYGTSRSGHKLSVLSYHTLRHYYLQKICDQRGVFAAQICGRHKNLRSTERYIKTSMRAKRDIVNSVFNTKEEKQQKEIAGLNDKIEKLTQMMEVMMTPQSQVSPAARHKMAEEESIAMLKNQIFAKHQKKNLVD